MHRHNLAGNPVTQQTNTGWPPTRDPHHVEELCDHPGFRRLLRLRLSTGPALSGFSIQRRAWFSSSEFLHDHHFVLVVEGLKQRGFPDARGLESR